jgi:hypothetical protein
MPAGAVVGVPSAHLGMSLGETWEITARGAEPVTHAPHELVVTGTRPPRTAPPGRARRGA